MSDEFGLAVGAGLIEDGVQVGLDGGRRQRQAIGDRRWAMSVREQARDGGFSGGEAVELSKDGRLGQRIAIWVHDEHQRCGSGRDDADRAAIDRQHTCRT